MLKTPHLTRSRATFARLYQSVDRSTCCGKPSALPRRTAASTARAIAHHCCGVAAPPCDAMADCTSRTTVTGFALRHELQHLCAGRQLSGSSGDPPWDTGTASSTTPWHGCRFGSDGSIGSPQIQHGSPLPRTRALSASRRWPLARRGFGLLDAMPPSIGRAPGHPAPPLPSPPRGRDSHQVRLPPPDTEAPHDARDAVGLCPAQVLQLHILTLLCAMPRTGAHDRATFSLRLGDTEPVYHATNAV